MKGLIEPTHRFRNLKVTGRYPNWRLQGEQRDTRWGGIFHSFMADFKLLVIRQALRSDEAAVKLWAIQDGMPNTHIDDEDWSGYRDSSPAAIDKMYKVARKYVNVDSLKKEIKKGLIKSGGKQ